MTEPNQCPRCGSTVKDVRFDPCNRASLNFTGADPWHTPTPQLADPKITVSHGAAPGVDNSTILFILAWLLIPFAFALLGAR